MGDVFESLGMAFEALRSLRKLVEEGSPALELADAYARLYGYLWQAYKDRFQKALSVFGVDFGFFWSTDAKFESGAKALLAEHPELEAVVGLMRRYRDAFQSALGYYRNTYLEHREAPADPRMLESFHRIEAAEETFENVWRAMEGIIAGLVAANLTAGFALMEIPERERDPARPARFQFIRSGV